MNEYIGKLPYGTYFGLQMGTFTTLLKLLKQENYKKKINYLRNFLKSIKIPQVPTHLQFLKLRLLFKQNCCVLKTFCEYPNNLKVFDRINVKSKKLSLSFNILKLTKASCFLLKQKQSL